MGEIRKGMIHLSSRYLDVWFDPHIPSVDMKSNITLKYKFGKRQSLVWMEDYKRAYECMIWGVGPLQVVIKSPSWMHVPECNDQKFKNIILPGLQNAIDNLMSEESMAASQIVDHRTFLNSPAWYMFIPMIQSPEARQRYVCPIKKPVLFQKMFSQPAFMTKQIVNSATGLYILYMSGFKDIFYNPKAKRTTIKGRNPSNGMLVLEVAPVPKMEHIASEICSFWGIPTNPPSFKSLHY